MATIKMSWPPYTAEELRELQRLSEITGEDSRLQSTLIDILERLDALEEARARTPTIYRTDRAGNTIKLMPREDGHQ